MTCGTSHGRASTASGARFDAIAELSAGETEVPSPHLAWLLDRVPARAGYVLDLGCGIGAVARRLAPGARFVVGSDLSARMLRLARSRSDGQATVGWVQADLTVPPWKPAPFDLIVAIAVLHHVSWDTALPMLRRWLGPGGCLLIQDLWRPASPLDRVRSLAAWPVAGWTRCRTRRTLRATPAMRRAWSAHGRHDRYPTMAEVRRLCHRHLPGALVRQHLCWRFSVVWRRPHDDPV